MTPEWFWQATPKELAWESEACRARLDAERTQTIEQAWMVAALVKSKRMPDLKKLIGVKDSPKKQTWQDMKARLKKLTGYGETDRSSDRTQGSQPRH